MESTYLHIGAEPQLLVDDDLIEKMKTDDVELFKFGILWLRFAIFGEDTMTIDGAVAATKEAELKAKQKIR